jgi:plasmid stabilization system protein ParE
MQLRWSEEAASDLERITNYLFEETPQHAPELVRAIYSPFRSVDFSPSRASWQKGEHAGACSLTASLHRGLSNRR